MKVIILAAGYATRLYPLTKDKPKALLPIGEKPLIDHIVDKLEPISKVSEIILVTNHRFYKVFSDWAEQRTGGLPVRVLDDGTTSNDDRLGAIGDLQFALKASGKDEDLLVLASDNLFEASLVDFVVKAEKNSNSATIGVYDIGDPKIAAGRYGIIEFDSNNKITAIEEKPESPKTTFVSMGVYFFAKETIRYVDDYMSSSDKKDAPGYYATWLLNHIEVYASIFHGKWYDIGSLDQLEDASKNYSS